MSEILLAALATAFLWAVSIAWHLSPRRGVSMSWRLVVYVTLTTLGVMLIGRAAPMFAYDMLVQLAPTSPEVGMRPAGANVLVVAFAVGVAQWINIARHAIAVRGAS